MHVKTQNPYITYEFRDGILVAQYKDNIELDLEAARLCVKDRLHMCEGKEVPILVDGRKMKSMNKDARDYLSSEEGSTGIRAVALLLSNPLSRFMGNFFMNVNVIRTRFPVRLFSTEKEALRWLKKFELQ